MCEDNHDEFLYNVNFGWDNDDKVWVAICEDPAFAIENEDIKVLAERVEKIIPEMLGL